MQKNKERTLKENYEAITQILKQNQKQIIEIQEAIQNIKDIHRVVIPILEAFKKPQFEEKTEVVSIGASKRNIVDYEMSMARQITFNNVQVVSEGNEEKIQEWLDKYSPIKLHVESIESSSYPYGDKVITVSLA